LLINNALRLCVL